MESKTKQVVCVSLSEEDKQVLARLKQARKTRNSSQIFREALWELAEKILPKDTHSSVFQCVKGEEYGRD